MGFDIGTDKFNSREYGICFSPIFIFRYTINKHFKVALREEYYKDKKQIFITTNQNSFALFGISTNLDYQITKTVLFRLEGKLYQAENEIFKTNSKENFSFTSNLTIKL